MNRWLCGTVIAWSLVVSANLAAPRSLAAAEDAAPSVVMVTGNQVNIRAGANRNYEVIHQVNRGEPLIVVGQQGEWYAVELPPEASCFIAAQYVAREGAASGRVTGTNVNLRGGQGTRYNALGKVSAGEPLIILGEQEGWLRIVPPMAARGWIAASLVQPDPAGAPEAVRAAYEGRRTTVASGAPTLVPPTGAGTTGGRPVSAV